MELRINEEEYEEILEALDFDINGLEKLKEKDNDPKIQRGIDKLEKLREKVAKGYEELKNK